MILKGSKKNLEPLFFNYFNIHCFPFGKFSGLISEYLNVSVERELAFHFVKS